MAVIVTRRKSPWHDAQEIEISGAPVRMQAKRLTLDEFGEFKLDFGEFMRQGRRGVPVREPGEEALTDDQVWERRLLLDTQTYAKDRERLKTKRGAILAFFERTVTEYVRVLDGELQDEDGAGITTGADLWQAIQYDDEVLAQCVMTVYMANTLSEDAKKKLPSWPALLRSLRARQSAANGDAPAPTAPSAENSTSVGSEAATDTNENDPSGSMVH